MTSTKRTISISDEPSSKIQKSNDESNTNKNTTSNQRELITLDEIRKIDNERKISEQNSEQNHKNDVEKRNKEFAEIIFYHLIIHLNINNKIKENTLIGKNYVNIDSSDIYYQNRSAMTDILNELYFKPNGLQLESCISSNFNGITISWNI